MERKPGTSHIRWMIRADMPRVLMIEELCFAQPLTWTEDDFIRTLRRRDMIGMVIEDAIGEIRGYMLYELHRTRLHIVNFAVHPAYHREGFGAEMVKKLFSKLSRVRRNRILLEVREGNTAAHLFFKVMGFKAIQVLKDFYEDSAEDAYLFEAKLVAPASRPEPQTKATP